VPGNEVRIVLEAHHALEKRGRKIAHLAEGAGDKGNNDALPHAHVRVERHEKIVTDDPGGDGRDRTAHGAFYGLVGAAVRSQFVLPEGFAAEQRGGIAYPRGEARDNEYGDPAPGYADQRYGGIGEHGVQQQPLCCHCARTVDFVVYYTVQHSGEHGQKQPCGIIDHIYSETETEKAQHRLPAYIGIQYPVRAFNILQAEYVFQFPDAEHRRCRKQQYAGVRREHTENNKGNKYGGGNNSLFQNASFFLQL